MPIWTIVLLGILAVLLLLLFLPITLRLYYRETVCLKVQFLLFSILLYPREKKPVRAQDFTEKALKKRSEKLKKKAEKAAAKRKKKAAKKEASRKKTTRRGKKDAQQPPSMDQIMEQLPLLLNITKGVVLRFCRYLRVHTVSFSLVVASSDAAATALWYGAAVSAMDTLLGLLDTLKTTRRGDRRNISVGCDFCAEKPRFSCDLRFSLRLWQLLAVALGALRTYLCTQLKKADDPTQKSPEKEQAQAAARAAVVEEITSKK